MLFNYGSINIDHVYSVPHLVRPGETISSHSYEKILGGKGANQSIALGLAGADVIHWGRVGKADAWVIDVLRDKGVDTSCIEVIDSDSGHALIQVDKKAENSIVLHPGANHGFDIEKLKMLVSTASQGDWLLMQNECNALEEVINIAHDQGLSIAFNPAPMDADVSKLPLQHVQVLFLNRREAFELVGLEISDSIDRVLGRLSERFPETEVVLTLGSDGVCYQYGDQCWRLPAHRITALDTTAAGDTFIGYYMASRIDGLDVIASLRRASAAATWCVQHKGASSSIPNAGQVSETEQTLPRLTVTDLSGNKNACEIKSM